MWPSGYWPNSYWYSGSWPKTGTAPAAVVERGGFVPRKRKKDFSADLRARERQRAELEALFDLATGVPGAEARLRELLTEEPSIGEIQVAADEIGRLKREEEAAVFLIL